MKNKETTEKFIELRALGKTYDEIKTELEVSKPTLVKWSRKFKEEITLLRQALTERLVEKIVENNDEAINNIAANLEKIFTRKGLDDKVKQKIAKKSVVKLGDIFRTNVKSIGFNVNRLGDVEFMKIDFFE